MIFAENTIGAQRKERDEWEMRQREKIAYTTQEAIGSQAVAGNAQSEISSSIQRLRNIAERVGKNILEFERRIEPALSQPSPAAQSEAMPPSNCRVSSELIDIARILVACDEKLQELHARLQL